MTWTVGQSAPSGSWQVIQNDTELEDVDGCAATQRDLDWVEIWSDRYLM